MRKKVKNKIKNLASNDGFALVMVLIIVAVLTTLAIEMNFSSSIGAKITANLRDSAKAFYLAKSGITMSLQRVKMDTMAHKTFSQFIGNSDNQNEFWWTMPLMYPLATEMFGDLLEDANIDAGKMDAFSKDQDIGGSFIAEIHDESARINLNDLQLAGTTPNGAYLLLLNLISLQKFNKYFKYKSREDFVNRIVDWIDSNSELAGAGGGIEDADYYDYHVKNAPFFSPQEVKLVKDMTYSIYKELEPFITVFPYSLPQSTMPMGKVNINTAPREVVAAFFDRSVVNDPWEISKEIMKARDEGQAFSKKDEFIQFLIDKFNMDFKATNKPIPRAIDNILDIRTDYFRIKSSGMVNDSTKTITAVIDRKKNYTTLYWRTE